MIPPCLTLSNIRCVSRVNWSNPGKGVVPSSTPRCSSYWRGSFWVALDYSRQLFFFTYIWCRKKIWINFWNVFFFSLISSIFEKKTSTKKRSKSKFSWLALLFEHFLKLKFIPIWESKKKKKKKPWRFYNLRHTETKPKFLWLLYTKQRKHFFFTEK